MAKTFIASKSWLRRLAETLPFTKKNKKQNRALMEKQKIRIIKSYLSESKIEDAIELLMEITDGDELHKDIIVFSSRYHKVVRRENLGTIDDDKAQKEHSQIVFGLISTLNRIEKQLRSKKIEPTEKVTIEQDADYLKKFISKFKNKNIKITILGATGVGKTYTVNSLLGNPDGVIGHTYRGTFSPKVYDFEIESKHFNLYDLPGLGDFDDERFIPYYDKPIQDSDCFILVITPPRLLTSGVRSILEILLALLHKDARLEIGQGLYF
ncbi:MAG: GTPase [Saprospiraceae bacterium]